MPMESTCVYTQSSRSDAYNRRRQQQQQFVLKPHMTTPRSKCTYGAGECQNKRSRRKFELESTYCKVHLALMTRQRLKIGAELCGNMLAHPERPFCLELTPLLRDGIPIHESATEASARWAVGTCPICEKPSTVHEPLCIDHNHIDGAWKGMKCLRCNLYSSSVTSDTIRGAIRMRDHGAAQQQMPTPL